MFCIGRAYQQPATRITKGRSFRVSGEGLPEALLWYRRYDTDVQCVDHMPHSESFCCVRGLAPVLEPCC